MTEMMETKMRKITTVIMNNNKHMHARELTFLLHLGWFLNCLLVSSLLSTNKCRKGTITEDEYTFKPLIIP